MRVLQINNYHDVRGGSDKVYLDTIDLLQEHGHQVSCLSTQLSEPLPDSVDGAFVPKNSYGIGEGLVGRIRSARDFVYNQRVAVVLDDLIKRQKPDVAHLHIFYGQLSNSVLRTLRKHGIPTVMSIHEYRLLCPTYKFLTPDLKICERCAKGNKLHSIKYKCNKGSLGPTILSYIEASVRDMFFHATSHIDHFIFVSDFIKNKHLEYHPDWKSKANVIYNFIDDRVLRCYRVALREKGDHFIYHGRLSYEKGLFSLLKAFSQRPHLKLILVGCGPAEGELRQVAMHMGLNNVTFAGFMRGAELYTMVATARYSLLPAEWYENFPISVIESVMLGTPMIASNIGGLPELVDDGRSGFLHTAGDVGGIVNALDAAVATPYYPNIIDAGISKVEAICKREDHYQKLMEVYTRTSRKQMSTVVSLERSI